LKRKREASKSRLNRKRKTSKQEDNKKRKQRTKIVKKEKKKKKGRGGTVLAHTLPSMLIKGDNHVKMKGRRENPREEKKSRASS